jgi:hypothetical protein
METDPVSLTCAVRSSRQRSTAVTGAPASAAIWINSE